MFHVPEHFRENKHPVLKSDSSYGNNGFFVFSIKQFKNEIFRVQASDGLGWEHVSLSLGSGKIPTWEMMCRIKEIFWDEEDCVIQYHPAKSKYINNHPGVLHLWRPTEKEIPAPDSILVGFKNKL